jgi:ADP-heptose:LPS heptosyltransferase
MNGIMAESRILVLNLIPNTIGDNILVSPFLRILRKNYPNAIIDMTVSSLNHDLFLGNPDVDSLYKLEQLEKISDRKMNRLSKLGIYVDMIRKSKKQFKDKKYDLCFVLPPNFPLSILIPYLSNVKVIVGYTYGSSFLSFLLTKKTRYRGLATKDYERHFIESYFDLLRLCSLKWNKSDEVCKVYLSDKEKKEAMNLLKGLKVNPSNYICFQAGTKDNGWEISRFAEVASSLKKSIILLGTKQEYDINQKITDVSDNAINLSGRLSLRMTAAILSYAKFSVCNDSGLAHLSSAVGTKTIVLYGPHSPKHCIPLGKGKVYPIYKYKGSTPYAKRGSKEGIERINAISVMDVLDVALGLI